MNKFTTYFVSSIFRKLGSKNAVRATIMIPTPQITNHFSTPNFSAKGPEMRRPNGIAKDAALVSNEKTLPNYSG